MILYLPYVRDELYIGTESWEDAFNLAPAVVDAIKAQIIDIRPDFVRMPIYWKYVEPADDSWTWPAYYDAMVNWLVSQGIQPVLTLKWTPDWALAPGEHEGCGRPADVSEFAEFANKVADHWKTVNNIVFEIWNEPDSSVGPQSPPGTPEPDKEGYYGCWGDPNETNYGGGFYLSVLNAVYPAIKSANPKAKVAAGVLMIPGEPDSPLWKYALPWADSPNYDILSYHEYEYPPLETTPEPYYAGAKERFSWRYEYLQSLTNRPLLISEAALLKYTLPNQQQICNDQLFLDNSVKWATFLRDQTDKVMGASWFYLGPDQFSWKCADLYWYSTPPWAAKPVKVEWEKP